MITVEIAYAEPDCQKVVSIQVEDGTTLIEAIRASAIAESFPDLDVEAAKKGVFGELKPDDYCLGEGDRVEIYRPLTRDPREARRRRAGKKS